MPTAGIRQNFWATVWLAAQRIVSIGTVDAAWCFQPGPGVRDRGMEPAVLKAQVGSLEQELELKDETLRAQADELDALRRELRIKDTDLRELQTSQRLAQAENKKVQTERRELEEVVASQKRELATAQLAMQAEREGRHKLRDEVRLREEQLSTAREEVARQAAALGELREATDAAVAKQAEAEGAADVAQRERGALQQQQQEGREEAQAAFKQQLGGLSAQRDQLLTREQEQVAQLAVAAEDARRLQAELQAREQRLEALGSLLEQARDVHTGRVMCTLGA